MRLALAFALVLLAACGGPETASEAQILEWVENAQQAAEAKRRRELIDMISPAYKDARSNGRDDIENLLRVYFLRQHRVALLTNVESVRIIGDTAAEVELTVGMAGTNDGVLGFSADAYRFELELERDSSDWQLISARWGELGEDLR